MTQSYLDVVGRRWRLVAYLTLLISVLVGAFLMTRPDSYRSVALIEVTGGSLAESVLGENFRYEEPDRRLATEVEVLQSRPVSQRAAVRLADQGVDLSADDAAAAVEIAPRGVSNYLEIAGRGSTARQARLVTQSYVDAYFAYRDETQTAELTRLERDLRAQLTAASAELARLPQDVDPASVEARQRVAAAERVDTAARLLESVRLRSSVETSSVRLLSPASLPSEPQGLSTASAYALSLVCGLLLALAVVFALEVWRDPVRTREEAEDVAGSAALAVLPCTVRGRGKQAQIVLWGQGSAAAARSVQVALGTTERERLARVIVSGPVREAAAASRVARSLAYAHAAAGDRVLLVEDQQGDSAGPFEGQDNDGQPTWWRDEAMPGVAQANLTSGPSGVGLVDAGPPSTVLAEVERHFDVLIVVAPDSSSVEPVVLGAFSAQAVVTVLLGKTKGRALKAHLRSLHRGGVTVAGLIVLSPTASRGPRVQLAPDRPLRSKGSAELNAATLVS